MNIIIDHVLTCKPEILLGSSNLDALDSGPDKGHI